tara:strand:+ start:41 stop:406 length:366 start_codon:yes stop_codon:yes gene_type:complete
MINQLGLIFLTIISYEIIRFFNLKKLTKENLDIYHNLIKNFLDNQIDDRLKQKKTIEISKTLLKISFKIFLCIGLILILICIINYLNTSFIEFLFSLIGIIETIILFFLYSLLRKKRDEKL